MTLFFIIYGLIGVSFAALMYFLNKVHRQETPIIALFVVALFWPIIVGREIIDNVF